MYSLLTLLCAVGALAAELNTTTVYQFSSNDTWLENLAVRSNGIILTTEIGPPASLLAFDPREETPQKVVLHTFDSVLGLSGITEAAPDVFYITGANTTADNISDPPANATHVWRVDFTGNNENQPEISLIARPTAPTGFNGLAAFNESIILATATYQEAIFAVDTTTGETWEAITNDMMSSINGIKVRDGYVYWTAGADFCRAKLYPNVTAGAPQLIAQGIAFDDFALAPDGFGNTTDRMYAYLATAAENTVMQVSFDLDGGNNQSVVIAGNLDSIEIAEPTACAFGRGEGEFDHLYITTGGGSGVNVDVNGVDTAVGAQLLEITL
ncbi:hypothetical protein ASPZODRAFT_137048 [Penicilliopsis zonata CBS 506.65]|uniref:SMP-30/Gluconolactonase/LRE-like region domain-containing protein n=1 Tax=Penicilliopsis zonata CBS 506.65 TaxID=1073090 RepID=A0A1L9S672_9EURO|nr:hypothetical protein ASPZODRAFT_137048 [Penicilliopsis zonata CBS 506.65]OJJ42666.1 hypothetical protein ASPZODRAFT_137048 [Penicilliopsis zonata CBS 506.65]